MNRILVDKCHSCGKYEEELVDGLCVACEDNLLTEKESNSYSVQHYIEDFDSYEDPIIHHDHELDCYSNAPDYLSWWYR